MVAIVIPYYKLKYFEKTLQSLANQTNKNFKVYIGNDNSPENPDLLLDFYRDKIIYKYFKFNNNLGGISLTNHWKRCLEKVQDEKWIMILGDDDVLASNCIEEFYKVCEIYKNKTNVFRFSSQVITDCGLTVSKIYIHPRFENSGDSFYKRIKGNSRSSLSEYIFSKNSYLKHQFVDYPLAWHSDDMAWLDFSDKKKIFSINEAIVFIRISNENITGKN